MLVPRGDLSPASSPLSSEESAAAGHDEALYVDLTLPGESATVLRQEHARRVFGSSVSTPASEAQIYLDIITKRLADIEFCLLTVQSEENRTASDRSERLLQRLAICRNQSSDPRPSLPSCTRGLSQRERARILNWLSQEKSENHHLSEGRDYLPGSGAWLLGHPEFLRWRETQVRPLSSGFMAPRVVARRNLLATPSKSCSRQTPPRQTPLPIAYFYCARSPAEPARSSPDEVLRGILKQLSTTAPGRNQGHHRSRSSEPEKRRRIWKPPTYHPRVCRTPKD